MENAPLIKLIESYCKDAGISPATLGVRAVGNSRLYDRLKRRRDRDADVADRVRQYIIENPPAPQSEDAA